MEHTTIIAHAHEKYDEVISLKSDAHEHAITVHAHEGALVRIVCEGKNLAGTLKLTITADSGATVLVGIACTVSKADRLVITSTQNHASSHATTRLWVRKIVIDHGHATFQGTIHIASQAQQSIVSQDDKTLLDGDYARSESVPALEVLAHDVACSHGSAIGRIDPSVLWYLHSRGLALATAVELWHAAFLAEARYAVFK
jgi:Fe-S cluster assembly scaffold protein SufB